MRSASSTKERSSAGRRYLTPTSLFGGGMPVGESLTGVALSTRLLRFGVQVTRLRPFKLSILRGWFTPMCGPHVHASVLFSGDRNEDSAALIFKSAGTIHVFTLNSSADTSPPNVNIDFM